MLARARVASEIGRRALRRGTASPSLKLDDRLIEFRRCPSGARGGVNPPVVVHEWGKKRVPKMSGCPG